MITPARTGAARYLGYEITTQHANHKITHGQRSVNGTVMLRVPQAVIKAKCSPYLKRGKPERRPHLMNLDNHLIINTYGAEYRGFVQYYLLAQDVFRLEKLRWVMETSMLKTLAGKHKSTVTKMARTYKASIDTPDGPRTCFQVTVHREHGKKPLVARFGGIPLKRQRTAVMTDLKPILATGKRNELIRRLLAGRCELYEATERLQVHHIRKLADLNNQDDQTDHRG